MAVMYARTDWGQFIYDIGFTNLSDQYLARKWQMPIAKIRTNREAFKRGMAEGRAEERAAKRKRSGKR
jgi:hypothetical protein